MLQSEMSTVVALRAGGFNALEDSDMHGGDQKPLEERQPAGPQRQSGEASSSSMTSSSASSSAAATAASSFASTSAAAAAPHPPVVACNLPVQRLTLSPAAEVPPHGSSHVEHESTEGSADAHMDLEEVLEPEPTPNRTAAWAISQMEQALLALSTSSDGGASDRSSATTDSAVIDVAMAAAIPGRDVEVKQIADFIGSRLCSDSAEADAALGLGKASVVASSRVRRARTTSAPVATPRMDGASAGAAGGTGALYLCGKPGTGKTMSVTHAVQVAVERARADGVIEPKISQLNASAFPQPAELYARVHADLLGESSSLASSPPVPSSRARSASDSGSGSSSATPGSATDHEAELRQFFQALDEAAAEGMGLGGAMDDATGTGIENVAPTPAPANSRQTSSRSSTSGTSADNGSHTSTNSRKRGAGSLSLSGRAGKKGRQSVNNTVGGAGSTTGKAKGQSRAKTAGSIGAEAVGVPSLARPLVLVLDEVGWLLRRTCSPQYPSEHTATLIPTLCHTTVHWTTLRKLAHCPHPLPYTPCLLTSGGPPPLRLRETRSSERAWRGRRARPVPLGRPPWLAAYPHRHRQRCRPASAAAAGIVRGVQWIRVSAQFDVILGAELLAPCQADDGLLFVVVGFSRRNLVVL